MRFGSLHARNIGPFGEVDIDFDLIPGLLLAICGPNGAGKSTMLEMLSAAVTPGRTCPTRGDLASLATARDSELAVRVVNGQPWNVSLAVDAVSGKGEARVTDASGRDALPDRKVRSFDDWARKTLPAPEVLFASTFAPQGSGGFLAMKPAERKAVLLRTLGIERLETLAKNARELASAAKSAFEVASARLRDERRRAGVGEVHRTAGALVAHADIDLQMAQAALAEAEDSAKAAEQLVEDRRAEAARVAAENAEAQARRTAIAAAEEARAAADRRINGLTSKLCDLRMEVLDQADAIRAAVARVAAADPEISRVREQLASLRAEERASAARSKTATAARVRAAATQAHARAKREDARRAAERIAAAAEEAAELPAARAALAEAEAHLVAAEARVDDLQAMAAKGAGGRVEPLREALAWYSDGCPTGNARDDGEAIGHRFDDGARAGAVLAQDNEAAQALMRLPDDLSEATRARAELRRLVDTRRTNLAALERRAAEASGPDPLPDADAALAAADEALAAAQADDERAIADEQRVRAAIAEAHGRLDELAKVLASEQGLAGRSEELAGAEATRASLDEQIAQAETDKRNADLQIEHAGLPPALQSEPDVAGTEKAAREAVGQVATKRARVGDAERSLAESRAAADRIAELENEAGRAEEDLADWTRLAQDLGKDGLQSMEIDAAGPELTALVNDLLHTCVGPRWTVTIEASRASADGKKTIEGCEVRVLDVERGREAPAETLSGGESVIVGEAVSLALAMLACRRWGVEGPTLVRDESGAALDGQNAQAYVAMLRRSAELVGASKVLLVSHSRDVQERCDARIIVEGGTVRVAA